MLSKAFKLRIKGFFQRLWFSFGLLAVLLVGFTSLALAQGNVLTDPPKNFELVQGWYQGRETFYYDFGANTPATPDGSGVVTAPIYVLVTGFDDQGNPQVVEGQHNIVDVIPGDPGYSDLWEVNFVTVPQDYIANRITSADELLNQGYEITKPGIYVNCPIVPAGSTLAEGGSLVQGWYKGQEVYYFDFGQNAPITAPIYVLVTGFDASGNPQPVAGQANLIDVIPGDEGYSAFWDVHFVTVPADYQANFFTSADQVLDSGYEVTRAGIVVNCPVIRTAGEAGAMAEGEAMMEGEMAGDEAMMAQESPAALPATGGDGSALSLWAIIAIVGAVLVGFGFLLRPKLS